VRLNKSRVKAAYDRLIVGNTYIFHVGKGIPAAAKKLEKDGKGVTLVRFNI